MASLTHFDAHAAHAVLDRVIAELTVPTLLDGLVLPTLRRIGDLWGRGDLTVGHEHFASALLRERVLGLGRHWDLGQGPRVLLACPAGERHDIGLICFGIAISLSGWRVTFLGQDTPTATILDTAVQIDPTAIVLAVTTPAPMAALVDHLPTLTTRFRVGVAGRAVDPVALKDTGAVALTGEPSEEAHRLASDPGWQRVG